MSPVIGEKTVRQLGQDAWNGLHARYARVRATAANQLNCDTLAIRREQVRTALQRKQLRASAQSMQAMLQRRSAQAREGLKPANLRTTLQQTLESTRVLFSSLATRFRLAEA